MKKIIALGVLVSLLAVTAVQAASTATVQVVTQYNDAPAMGCVIDGVATANGQTTKFTRHSVSLVLPSDVTVSFKVHAVCAGKTYNVSRTSLLRRGTNNVVMFDLK